MIIVCKEEQSLSCQTGQVICPAVWEIARRCTIIQIEPFTELLFQPLFCGTQSPLFLNGKKNLVQAEELIFALGLFRHKATNVFVVCIGIGVDRRICQRILIYKVINEF